MLAADQQEHPRQFGRYELSERLAEGRTCDVFLATSHGVEGFRRTVVIKRLHPRLTADDDFVERYLFQVKRLFPLSHANIVQVLDLDEFDGHYFLTEEYVEGYDLAQLRDMAAAGSLLFGAPLGLYIVAEVVKGVEYGHRRLDPSSLQPLKLCHGDLHPRNILVGFQGEVKVADFGIFQPLEEYDLSGDQGVLRAYAYASPETANGQPPTQQSDAFALGLMTVEACAGRHPYAARSADRVREKAKRGVVSDRYINQVPTSFRDLVRSSLQQDPTERLIDLGILYDRIISYLHEEHDYAGARPLAAFVEDVADVDLRTAVVYSGMIASEHYSSFPSDPGLTPMEGLSGVDLRTVQAKVRQAATELTQFTLPGADKEPLGANGRDREIEWIEEELPLLEQGHCRGVFISGPRGVGKSHLMRVVHDKLWAKGVEALLLMPTLDAQARPYGLIMDILAGVLTERPLLWTPDPRSHLVAALEAAGLGDAESRQRMGQLVLLDRREAPVGLPMARQSVQRIFEDLVASRPAASPLVLLLDNIERADVSSMEFLHSMLAVDAPGPCLMVMSSLNRGLLNEFGRAATESRRTSIVLGPLDDEDTRALMSHIAGSAPSPEMVQSCEGMPCLAIELAIDWKFGSGEAIRPVVLDPFVRNLPPLQLGILSMLSLAELSMPMDVLAEALQVEEEKGQVACRGLAALHLISGAPSTGWSLGLRTLAAAIDGAFNETVKSRARRRAATLLSTCHQVDNSISRPPRARLLAQAGAREDALDIGRAHRDSLIRSGFTDVALSYLDHLAAMADRQTTGLPRDALHFRLEQVQLAISAYRLERGQQALGGLVSRAADLRDEEGLLIASAQQARIALRYGDIQRAEELVLGLETLLDTATPLRGLATVALARAECCLARGQLRQAAHFLEKAYSGYKRIEPGHVLLAELRFRLTHLLCRRDEIYRAFELLDDTSPRTSADEVTHNRCRGYVALLDEEFDAAVQYLDAAFVQAEREGWSVACLAIAPELAVALFEAGRFEQGESRLTSFNQLAGLGNDRSTQARLASLEHFAAALSDERQAQAHLDALESALTRSRQENRVEDALELSWLMWRATRGTEQRFGVLTRELAEQAGDLARYRRIAVDQL